MKNKDQIKGKVEEVKGKVKEAAGVLLDDKGMEIEGNIQKNVGKPGRALVISRKTLKILRKILKKRIKTSTAELCGQVQTHWPAARRQRDALT